MNALPIEIVDTITSYLHGKNFLNFISVCRYFRKIFSSEQCIRRKLQDEFDSCMFHSFVISHVKSYDILLYAKYSRFMWWESVNENVQIIINNGVCFTIRDFCVETSHDKSCVEYSITKNKTYIRLDASYMSEDDYLFVLDGDVLGVFRYFTCGNSDLSDLVNVKSFVKRKKREY